MVAYFVRTLGLGPNDSRGTPSLGNLNLTTGTFNLVVKDRIAFPPERRVSVHANSSLGRIRVSSKPFKNIVLLAECQSGVFTGFPHGTAFSNQHSALSQPTEC